MKTSLAAALLAALVTVSAPLGAAFAADSVVVSDAWARASAGPAMKTGAAYATIANAGAELDRLVGAESPVAQKAELHTHLMVGGVMKMRPVKAIEVNPGAPVVLAPGGLHVMLIGLKGPLKEGTSIPLTLIFEKAGRIDLTVPVLSAGALGPGNGGDAPHAMEMKPRS